MLLSDTTASIFEQYLAEIVSAIVVAAVLGVAVCVCTAFRRKVHICVARVGGTYMCDDCYTVVPRPVYNSREALAAHRTDKHAPRSVAAYNQVPYQQQQPNEQQSFRSVREEFGTVHPMYTSAQLQTGSVGYNAPPQAPYRPLALT
jgi:hypothetical protein